MGNQYSYSSRTIVFSNQDTKSIGSIIMLSIQFIGDKVVLQSNHKELHVSEQFFNFCIEECVDLITLVKYRGV